MYAKCFKRLIDIVLAGIGLVVMAIPFLFVAILIKCEDPGPAIFKQKRIGLHKELFTIYKFRSMKMDTPHDLPTHMLTHPEQHILHIGGFLRKYSIDELPQMWNILKGDMSIVGPRPVVWNTEDLIEERDKYGANDVRPGLTGWAQINGRDELDFREKARLDGYYVQNLCFIMDVKCFLKTIICVLKHEGVVEGNNEWLKENSECAH